MERTLRVWACVLAGVIALMLGGGARGQDELTTDAERLKHYYWEELESLSRIVSLTEAQREAALTLYQEWARRSALANKKVSAFYESVESFRHGVLTNRAELFNEASRKSQRHRDRLRAELNSDLLTLLSEQQLQKWPEFERDLRRRHWLGQAWLFTGGGIDLVDAMESVAARADLSEEVRLFLEEYKSAIDPAVRALEQTQRAWMKIYWSQTTEQRRSDARYTEEAQLAAACRNAQSINLRHARALLELLSNEQRKALEDRLFRDFSYYAVNWNGRRRFPQELMRQAYQAEELSIDQKAALDESMIEFEPLLRDFQRRMFEACVAVEADTPDVEFRQNAPDRVVDPRVEAVLKSSDELVAQFAKAARLILTEEQVRKLGPPYVEAKLIELNLDDEE